MSAVGWVGVDDVTHPLFCRVNVRKPQEISASPEGSLSRGAHMAADDRDELNAGSTRRDHRTGQRRRPRHRPPEFRGRLTGMAHRRGVAVIGVDAAYTSRWGAQHWRKPLQQQASDPAAVTGHHGAAVAIGRRGLGVAIRRRPAGPRTRQRTGAGAPPARPDHPPTSTRRCRSSGSPPRPQRRRGVPVHQTTPTASGQHRSGRMGLRNGGRSTPNTALTPGQ